MNRPPKSDAEIAVDLARRIRQGDADAENELVERYRNGLVLFLRSATRGHADVEDLCQQALLTSLEKLRAQDLEQPEKLKGFLTGIAKNHVANWRRLYRHRATDPDKVSPPTDPGADAYRRTAAREKLEIVRAVIDELPARDRDVLRRFYLDDEERESIQASWDLTPEQFKKVFSRARKRLRERYETALQVLEADRAFPPN